MTRHQKSLAILGSIALSITWVERSLVGRAVVASAQAASASQAGQGPEDPDERTNQTRPSKSGCRPPPHRHTLENGDRRHGRRSEARG